MESSPWGHLWIEPFAEDDATNHVIVVGSPLLQATARALRYPPRNTLATLGMVVHPSFYGDGGHGHADAEADSPRAKADRPAAVIFFGGFAPNRAEAIARHVLERFEGLDVLVLCGGNAPLVGRLEAWGEPRLRAEGFVPSGRVRDHFRRAAFVIGKPGPGVVAEASVSGVPIVVDGTATMAQVSRRLAGAAAT